MKKLKVISCIFILGTIYCQVLPAKQSNEDDVPFVSLTRTNEHLRNLPTNVTVITSDEIKQKGAKSLDEVIDLSPSVDVSKSGTLGSFSTFRMRGVPSSSQVQVIIDDQPLGGVSSQFVDLSQIPTDNIDRIEIVRGGSSVLYGANCIGGVVHVHTKKRVPGKPEVNLGLEGRSFQTKIVRASAGGATQHWAGFFSGSRFHTDGFQENSDADQKMGSGTVGYRFNSGTQLGLDLYSSQQNIGNPHGTLVPISEWDGEKERAAVDKNERVIEDKTEGRARLISPLTPGLLFFTQGYGSRLDFENKYVLSIDPFFNQEDRIFGNDTRLMWDHGLTLGAAYEWDGRETVTISSSNRKMSAASHITNYAFYLQEVGKWHGIRMIPAVRYDHHSAFGGVFNPRLSLVYDVRDWWSVSGNAARSFRAPSFLELFYKSPTFNGNSDLNPETAWTYDIGNRLQFSDTQMIKITGFYTRISDRISVNKDFSSYTNAPKAEMMGCEFEWSAQMGQFQNTANYTYQRAQGNSIFSSQYVPLRMTPRHLANAILSWHPRPGWFVDNILQYTSRQYRSDNEQGLVLPSRLLWNARIAKNLGPAEIYFGVNNITNRRYAESFDMDFLTFLPTYNPQPGRNYWGGVNLRL